MHSYWIAVTIAGVLNAAVVVVANQQASNVVVNVETDKCTAIAVGPKAGVDGTMTTHTMDCFNCDFRINKVPAKDWDSGSKRPLHIYKADYPAQVDSTRGDTWQPSNLEGTPEQIEKWEKSQTITGHIPQVEHTYAMIEGGYGIMNEYQVAIGESTCASKLWAKPTTAGGAARIEVAEMSKIGLERGKTAREVIQIMGDLATTYGFYAADWSGGEVSMSEGGEGLTVVDKTEAWVFHVTSDDTGTSAIWVAQRVPDDHVTVIANQFIIREVDPDDHDNFMYSDNLWEVAKRTGFWNPKDSPKMDFLKTFGPSRKHPPYATRRIWRVFQLVAPTLSLPADTDSFQDDYPFSVKAEKQLTVEDVISIQRDHYQGTKFDLGKGLAAGPYGDPNRFDIAPVEGASFEMLVEGGYERAISMFRTSYSFVANPRTKMPDPLGVVWFGQYNPASCSYTPLYVFAQSLPTTFTRGSLFKYDPKIAYWNFLAAGNYAARFYKYAMEAVYSVQEDLHSKMLSNMKKFEQALLAQLEYNPLTKEHGGDLDFGISAQLTVFSQQQADMMLNAWQDLLPTLITTYHDGMKLVDATSESINLHKYFYPLWWLNATGFFENKAFDGPNVIAFQPSPFSDIDSTAAAVGTDSTSESYRFLLAMVLTAVTASVLTLGAVALVLRKRASGTIAPTSRFDYARIEL